LKDFVAKMAGFKNRIAVPGVIEDKKRGRKELPFVGQKTIIDVMPLGRERVPV
jgi:hypothetical protein